MDAILQDHLVPPGPMSEGEREAASLPAQLSKKESAHTYWAFPGAPPYYHNYGVLRLD